MTKYHDSVKLFLGRLDAVKEVSHEHPIFLEERMFRPLFYFYFIHHVSSAWYDVPNVDKETASGFRSIQLFIYFVIETSIIWKYVCI